MKIRIAMAIGAIYLIIGATLSHATPYIDQANILPPHLTVGSGTWNLLSREYLHQSFQTNAGNIVGAEIFATDQYMGTSYELTINLMDTIGGNILASGAIDTGGNDGYIWQHVDFNTGVSLSAGTTYYLSFLNDNSVARTLVHSFFSPEYDSYTAGDAYRDGIQTTYTDFVFRTIADDEFGDPGPGTTPVPEPATLLLFGAGLAGLISARQRKKKSVR